MQYEVKPCVEKERGEEVKCSLISQRRPCSLPHPGPWRELGAECPPCKQGSAGPRNAVVSRSQAQLGPTALRLLWQSQGPALALWVTAVSPSRLRVSAHMGTFRDGEGWPGLPWLWDPVNRGRRHSSRLGTLGTPQQPRKLSVHTGPYFNMLILSGGMNDLRALPGCLCLHLESQEREIGTDTAAPGSGFAWWDCAPPTV